MRPSAVRCERPKPPSRRCGMQFHWAVHARGRRLRNRVSARKETRRRHSLRALSANVDKTIECRAELERYDASTLPPADGGPSPRAFVAVTVHVYALPVLAPVTNSSRADPLPTALAVSPPSWEMHTAV